jgi:hypothetical protein
MPVTFTQSEPPQTTFFTVPEGFLLSTMTRECQKKWARYTRLF